MLWVVEGVGDHNHDNPSKSFFHDLAFEFAVTKNMTSERAMIEIARKHPALTLPANFKRQMENMRAHASSSGKLDGRVVGILEAFLRAVPAGLFVLNATVNPVMIPFFFYGLDQLVASTIGNFQHPLNLVVDGTYKINRQNLVLLAVGVCGLRLLASGIVNQVLPIFYMVARVEENESWDLLFKSACEHYLARFGLDLSIITGAVFRDCSAGVHEACLKYFGAQCIVFRDLEHVKRTLRIGYRNIDLQSDIPS